MGWLAHSAPLTTLKGWWRDDDIAIREQHGLYPEPREGRRQFMISREAKRHLQSALKQENFDPGQGDDFFRLSRTVHSFLARCGSAIAMLQLKNLTGEESQTNLPRHFHGIPKLAQTAVKISGNFTDRSGHSCSD